MTRSLICSVSGYFRHKIAWAVKKISKNFPTRHSIQILKLHASKVTLDALQSLRAQNAPGRRECRKNVLNIIYCSIKRSNKFLLLLGQTFQQRRQGISLMSSRCILELTIKLTLLPAD